MQKPKAILFDLGRVLIELDGPPVKNAWLAEPISEEQSWLNWVNSPIVKQFETGAINEEGFLNQIVEEQKLIISQQAFKQAFSVWPSKIYQGAVELLQTLKKNGYVLAFYSNTNALHTPRFLGEWHFDQYFDFCFCSNEIGFYKPDPRGFEYVLDQMQLMPGEVLFVDDNLKNVQSAQELGLMAEQTLGFDQVKATLVQYHCI